MVGIDRIVTLRDRNRCGRQERKMTLYFVNSVPCERMLKWIFELRGDGWRRKGVLIIEERDNMGKARKLRIVEKGKMK